MGWLSRLLGGAQVAGANGVQAPAWQTPPIVPSQQNQPQPFRVDAPVLQPIGQPAPAAPQQSSPMGLLGRFIGGAQPQQSATPGAPQAPTIRSNPLTFALGGQNALNSMFQNQLAQQQQVLANQAEQRNQQMFGMQQTQFGWGQEDRQRQLEQRRAWQTAVEAETDENRRRQLLAIGPDGYAEFINTQQQNEIGQRRWEEEMALRRRGLAIDAARANREFTRAPELSRADVGVINQVTEASDQANAFNSEITRFLSLNRDQPTGPYTGYLPGSWFGESRARRDEMEGITSRLISSVRAMSGEGGIMTDADALRFERGLPSVNRLGQTNMNIAAASQQVARNAQDRVAFYENWARNPQNGGSLLGARSAWNEYLQRNPIFDEDGGLRPDRPGFEEWLAAGAPDMRRQNRPAGGGRETPRRSVRDMTDAELEALARSGR